MTQMHRDAEEYMMESIRFVPYVVPCKSFTGLVIGDIFHVAGSVLGLLIFEESVRFQSRPC